MADAAPTRGRVTRAAADLDEVFGPDVATATDDAAWERYVAALLGTLEAVWDNACETCLRPLHPRAMACPGCELDALRSGR